MDISWQRPTKTKTISSWERLINQEWHPSNKNSGSWFQPIPKNRVNYLLNANANDEGTSLLHPFSTKILKGKTQSTYRHNSNIQELVNCWHFCTYFGRTSFPSFSPQKGQKHKEKKDCGLPLASVCRLRILHGSRDSLPKRPPNMPGQITPPGPAPFPRHLRHFAPEDGTVQMIA
jgi:hypothetical protein